MQTVTSASRAQRDVHVAIMRKVRPGREVEFEREIQRFFGVAEHAPGVRGAYLVRPMPGSSAQEYGILRSFGSEDDMRRFYDSDLYRRWQDTVRPLVDGEASRRQLHGMEAFFREAGAPPPSWKMAVVTWLGVNPAVYIFAFLVPLVFGSLHSVATLLVVNLFVVASLTWFFMPILTRLFRHWLQPAPHGK